MKLSWVVLLLIGPVLGVVIGPAEPSHECRADNCYLAVAGNDVRFDFKFRRGDCSKFMATATPVSTYVFLCAIVVVYQSLNLIGDLL